MERSEFSSQADIEELLRRREELVREVGANGGGNINSAEHPLFRLLAPRAQAEIIEMGRTVLVDVSGNWTTVGYPINSENKA